MERYCEEHDANYDDKKDIWLEGNCGHKDCNFCKDRPKKPSMVKNLKSHFALGEDRE